MARKKAKRAYINEKIKKSHLGKFGDIYTNRLADKFRTKPLLITKNKSDLSLHRKMDILFTVMMIGVALAVAFWVML